MAAAISLASALIALYAVEAFFSLAAPSWADRLGTTLRRGPSVVGETYRLRQNGIEAYPFLQSDLFTHTRSRGLRLDGSKVVAPVAGIASELTVLCNESGTTIGYRSDSLGFRNTNPQWSSPRIALIGDSFAHGFCRTETETIPAHLERSGITALNTGVTGAGPLTELGILREYLALVEPPVVYWLFYEGNDLIDLTSERTTLVSRYLEPGFRQDLVDRRRLVDERMKQFGDSLLSAWHPPGFTDRARAFLMLRNLRSATGLTRSPSQPESRDESAELALLERVLSAAKREAQSWNGELRLVYLPERRRFNKSTRAVIGENHDPDEVRAAVTQITSRLGIPVIDVAAAFANTGDPGSLWNNRRYHYNAEGYRVVAESIAADLETANTTAVAGTERPVARLK